MSFTYLVDVVGSIAMLLLAVAIVYESYQMRQRSLIHLYLYLLACTLAAFAVSRALGHLVRRLVVTAGYADQWRALSPISGAINTVTFVIIAASSFLYVVFQRIQKERDERHAHYLAEMESARDFLQHVIDSLNAQLVVIDPGYNVRLVNQKLVDDLNSSREQLVGKKCHEVFHQGCEAGSDCRNVENEDHICPWKLMEQKKEAVILTHRHQKPDGEFAIMEIMASPVVNEEGELEYIIETLRDITEKVRLEEQLRQQEKLQGVVEMATAVAHELNTPMFTVLGNVQLIQRQMEKSDPFYEELEDIIHEVKRMSKLTRKMTTIRQYTAKDYVGDVRLVDIEKASEEEEDI
ncbi:MAG: PAS domain-containing protein [Deltaproteobacteria bacterium]|nr:PAS domain-containing protein [Deltaproteobacteria bacterium]